MYQLMHFCLHARWLLRATAGPSTQATEAVHFPLNSFVSCTLGYISPELPRTAGVTGDLLTVTSTELVISVGCCQLLRSSRYRDRWMDLGRKQTRIHDGEHACCFHRKLRLLPRPPLPGVRSVSLPLCFFAHQPDQSTPTRLVDSAHCGSP